LPRAVNLRENLYHAKDFIFQIIFLYLIVNVFVRGNIRRIIKWISAAGVILALIGISQHIFKYCFMVNCNLPEYRAMSTFGHPNDFAVFLMIIISFGAAGLFAEEPLKKKVYPLLSAVTGFIALLMTYSRSLWLCLIASLAVSLFFTKKKYLIILALFFGLIVLVLPGEYKQKFMKPVNMSDESHIIRVNLIKNSLNMIENNLLLGVGDGNSYYLYDKYKIYDTQDVKRNHTQILSFMSEYGAVGLLVFIWLLAGIYKLMFEKLKKMNLNAKIYQYSLIGIFTALLINAQFNGSFFPEPYVWLVMGLALI
jgi:hypothetical protein